MIKNRTCKKTLIVVLMLLIALSVSACVNVHMDAKTADAYKNAVLSDDAAYSYKVYPLKRNGIGLHLDRLREEGKDPEKNILLIHGLTYSSHEFDIDYEDYSLVRRLAREGYAVWRLDIAGYGQSDPVEDGFMPDSDYAAEDINAAVDEIVRITGEDKIDILGWSWGTVTVGRFAAKYNEHINSIVLYAPILSGIGEYEVTEDFHHNTWEHAADDFVKDEEGGFDHEKSDPVVIEMFCSSCWHYDGESSPNGGRRDLCVSESEKLIDLSKIKAPTLIICGDSDPYLNYDLVNTAEDSLPEGSKLEIIEGGSHVVFIEKPYYRDFQDRLIGFLNEQTTMTEETIKDNETDKEAMIERIISEMTLDEKISQMIILACRTWNEENITDLDSVPKIKEALKKHQYGGIILFGCNITDNEQVTRLLYDLQENNAQNENASVHIPYLTPVDEEGGIVIRLNSGTRMTGNMAIGATPDPIGNAEKTGEIIGEELAAAGFNTDYAPDIDVNNNPSNPVIGTRSFSDDPNMVAALGTAYAKGLSKSNIIATFKHYPGHGDTGVDSHIGTPSVDKTYDELRETELVPFKKAIENGADMIMTAHITYPLIDDEMTFGDGETKGFYPATMSRKMITDILRTEMGYKGVVVTDALEMDAIRTAGLVEGEEDSVEYGINIAEKVINAGVDILLIPADMKDEEAVGFYDEYISGIEALVESGEISEDRIDESVKRILMLKTKYGIFDPTGNKQDKEDIEDKVQNSLNVIGSESHHNTEMGMAREAITLLKNDKDLLPLSGDAKNIVVLGRLEGDSATLKYAVDEMKNEGLIDETAEVTVDYYYNSSADVKLNYTDEMKERISSADIVIGFSYASGSSALDRESEQYIGLNNAIEDVHKGGGRFILVSENLPYDAAIYQEADAIVLAYMGSGLNMDPTDNTESGTVTSAVNANIIAAIETIFGYNSPKGKLPVNIPVVEEKEDGTLEYGSDILYERGYGISFKY